MSRAVPRSAKRSWWFETCTIALMRGEMVLERKASAMSFFMPWSLVRGMASSRLGRVEALAPRRATSRSTRTWTWTRSSATAPGAATPPPSSTHHHIDWTAREILAYAAFKVPGRALPSLMCVEITFAQATPGVKPALVYAYYMYSRSETSPPRRARGTLPSSVLLNNGPKARRPPMCSQ